MLPKCTVSTEKKIILFAKCVFSICYKAAMLPHWRYSQDLREMNYQVRRPCGIAHSSWMFRWVGSQ